MQRLGRTASLLLLFAFALPAASQSGPQNRPQPPATVLLLGPAEHPIVVAPNFASTQSSPLTSEGFARAKDLPQLFTGPSPTFPRPDALFASHLRISIPQRSKKNKNTLAEPSTAPSVDTVLTLESLAKSLSLTVETTYADEDYPYLANVLLSGEYAGKVVLIVWHPSTLDKLAAALGVTPPPPAWPPAQFDRIWRIDWKQGAAKPTLTDTPQQLLPGDSK